MSIIIIASILSVLTLIMAYISYKYPFKNHDGKKTKAARLFGTFVILSIVGLGYVVYASIKIESNKIPEQAQYKKDLDSAIKAYSNSMKNSIDSQLKPFKLHLDDKKQVVRTSASYISNNEPFIFPVNGIGHYIKSDGVDTLKYSIPFLNKTAVNIIGVNIKLYIFCIKNDHIVFKDAIDVLKNSRFPANATYTYSNSIPVQSALRFDTTFFYVNGKYKNEKTDIDYVMYWTNRKKDSIGFINPYLHDLVVRRMKELKLLK